MHDTVVYRHLKPCGEVFYVGIGNEQRPYVKVNRNQFWHNVVNKYVYEVEVVATGLSWEDACELEELMILAYGRRDLGTGTLVNMTSGGDGVKGLIHSEETRQKMSAAKSGENHPMYGKKFSTEHRQKLSAAKSGENNHNYGKKHSAEHRQKLSAAQMGIPSPARKLTFKQAEEIRHRYQTEKTTQQKLSAEYSVSHMTISRIIRNQSYTTP